MGLAKYNTGNTILYLKLLFSCELQKETPLDIKLHAAAANGDCRTINQLIDTGRVHVDSRDNVISLGLSIFARRL